MTQPIVVSVLPKERRARHPYQLCMMLALMTIGLSQLLIGPPPTSAVTRLAQSDQNMLNLFCLFAGGAGVAAAIIPEKVIRWGFRRRHEFDATWIRLWEELGCHGLLFFVWAAYLVTISLAVPLRVGLSLGTGLVFWLGVAAAWRVVQIGWTIKRYMAVPHSGVD